MDVEVISWAILGWFAVLLLFILGLVFLAGWSFFRGLGTKDCIILFLIFIGIVLQVHCAEKIEEIINKLSDWSEHAYLFFVLLFAMILVTFLLVYLLSGWHVRRRKVVNEWVIMFGIMHVAVIMHLSTLPLLIQHKILINVIYLTLPALALHEITNMKSYRSRRKISLFRYTLRHTKNKL